MDNLSIQNQIDQLKKDVADLNNELYLNNFSAHRDFNKKCNFNTRLKVPHYASDPSTCEVGEIIEVGGKLKVCSATNTWTIVGTQT
jgi:hypothetical protein